MLSKFSFFLIALLIFLLIKELFIPIKNNKKFIAKGIYRPNILLLDILMVYVWIFSFFFYIFYNPYHKSYAILYPKYVTKFKDMFNYNKLIDIYNSLEKNNVPGLNYIHQYINNGLPAVFDIILFSLILIIVIINNSKNKIYENIIYVNGIGYTFDSIKEFKWSEKKTRNRFAKRIEYYQLTLIVEKKYKIFDKDIRKVTMQIKEKDKGKVNSVLTS